MPDKWRRSADLSIRQRSVTRGHGLLEGFLAGRRVHQAHKLIPDGARSGRILDIGCGSYPTFLLNSGFAERYGLDRVAPSDLHEPGLTILNRDVADAAGLPFENAFFDVVTMLAVFEHLERDVLTRLLREIHRVLRPGGVYVMTTPAHWTDPILNTMARLGLVSREEVEEHEQTYSHDQTVSMMTDAGFDAAAVRYGTFEVGMNLWLRAERTDGGKV
jgi:SAM-dependent methyltransferase